MNRIVFLLLVVAMIFTPIAMMVVGFNSPACAVEVTLGEPVPMVNVPIELVQKFISLGLSTDEIGEVKFVPIPLSDLMKYRKTILKHIDPGKKSEREIYLLLCHTT